MDRRLPYRLAAIACLALLAGCATTRPERNPLAEWHPSLNHNPRSAQIIVLHQTEMESAQAALLTLQTRNSTKCAFSIC